MGDNTDTVLIPDAVDPPPTPTDLPIATPKKKAGRPAGSKNKKSVIAPIPEEPPPKQAPKPVEPLPDADPPPRRPAKRKSRTRVIVLSSSESEDAPPPVRVVRKPRAAPPSPVVDESTDEEPPPTPRALPPRQSRQPRRFEPDVRAQHQQHLDARRATYDGYFQHLR